MNIAIAKKLMGAGFPYKHPEDFAYVPDLEELVDACGKALIYIERGDNEWFAYSSNEMGKGKIHKDAVANLWLKLHNK